MISDKFTVHREVKIVGRSQKLEKSEPFSYCTKYYFRCQKKYDRKHRKVINGQLSMKIEKSCSLLCCIHSTSHHYYHHHHHLFGIVLLSGSSLFYKSSHKLQLLLSKSSTYFIFLCELSWTFIHVLHTNHLNFLPSQIFFNLFF